MKVAVIVVLLPAAAFEEEPSPITMSRSGVLNLQINKDTQLPLRFFPYAQMVTQGKVERNH